MGSHPLTPRAQSILRWYRLYCGAMALMYLACVIGGAVLISLDAAHFEGEELRARVTGVLLAGLGAPALAAFALAFVLPRRRWAWTYGLVLICIGMTSVCCLPACVPLLIAWLGDDVKRAFGRAGEGDGAPAPAADDPLAGG